MTHFIRGSFIRYRTTKRFQVDGATFEEGIEVLFDGHAAKIGDAGIVMPQLKGAVKMGWLIPQ